MSIEYALIGAGGFGRELRDWIAQYFPEHKFIGFIDDFQVAKEVISTVEAIAEKINPAALIYCAVGSPSTRKKFFERVEIFDVQITSLHSPLSQIAATAMIGKGGIILGNSSVAANSSIGAGLLLQGFSVVGHDVVIGDYVSIYSFVFIGGGASIGNGSIIYPHAVILPGVRIGANVTIGAGSVVLKDVEDGVSIFGSPAKIIGRKAND